MYDENRVDFASPQRIRFWRKRRICEFLGQDPLVRQENIVGFEDETEAVIKYLTEDLEKLDVISMIGIPGLGITTLARKIFHDRRIQYEFPTSIWVYVSRKFTKRDVSLSILSKFTKITDDMY